MSRMIYRICFFFISFISFVTSAQASNYFVVTPKCLLNSTIHYQSLATYKEFRLIQLNEINFDQLIIAKTKRKHCGSFMDVTDAWKTSSIKVEKFLQSYIDQPKLKPKVYKIQYETQVRKAFQELNPQTMWANLTTLSSFPDRYARSDYGVKAAEWIKSQMETIAKETGHNDVTVYLINTGERYKQPSVVAKLGNTLEHGVVIGAHMDTLSSSFGDKPGADDDGSGSVTVLEAARTLLASGLHFKNPIYFMWYAAEEEGLVGSSYVVNEFKHQSIPVDSVLHFDMTGFAYHNETTIWLMKDYVNKDLTEFLQKLITTYLHRDVQYTACGYACSDHANWTQYGYPAALAAETAFEDTNPSMHSSRDTMDKLSLLHMRDYAKLATAFAIELAEPQS